MVRPEDLRAVDPIDRAHLTGVTRPSPPIHRYEASPHLADLVDRYWIPVWSVPAPSTQTTLQHPICVIVVSNTYARFYGVTRGRSSVTLEGDGWAVGTMLRPAAGRLLAGRSTRVIPLPTVWRSGPSSVGSRHTSRSTRLIQRRRLHDAVEALKAGRDSLADTAARLGYVDQAHFTHDFRTVTGMTPGEFLRDQPTSAPAAG